jgi:rod shape determining protein RodA
MVVLITIFRATLRFLREADLVLLVLSIFSSVYGVILISSATANFGTEGREVYVQIGALLLGIALFVLFSYIDIDIIADKSWLLYIFSMLFIFTLYFWGEGEQDWGNRAWLRFLGIGVQPAEVVKVTFAIIIAKMIVNYKERKSLNSIISLMQILFVFGSIFVLIIWVSADLGSAIIFVFMLATMLFVGGVKLRWFALGAAILAALSPLLWNLMEPYQQNRIRAPFFPDVYDPDRQGVLWQAHQSVRAITGGRWTGQGLGNGRFTQAGFIPEQHTDFVFSVAGEELGFLGCMLIIVLLVAIIVRCFYIGVKSNNPLGLIVCTGLAAKLIAQTFENIGMCLGLLPVIGITLPFFSYGGSSLVTCFAAMGIVSGIKMRPKPIRFRNL